MPADDDPDKWGYPPHTKAKHDMLGMYLDGWYPTLSSWSGRLVFLDGFAGRGRYTNGAEGSPLIALKRLINHTYFPRMRQRQFVFIFAEANEANANNLEGEIARLKREYSPWPPNISVQIAHSKFDQTASEMISVLREQKKRLAPTFAFIDPFGYSGMPMELIAELLAYPQTEVFVNFMVGHVQRFISRDGQEAAMRSLFGMDVRDVLDGYSADADRVEHLGEVYKNQLHNVANFDYVQSFAMKNKTGNTSYRLLHGTRHIKGVKLMKAAMWSIDPGAGCVFSDRLANEDVLFTPDPDLAPLRREFLRHYAGRREVPTDEIVLHALVNTPFRDTHVRPILKRLETEGTIAVRRDCRSGTFKEGHSWISFPD